MAGVELEEVRKVYAGNVEAVKGVSLDIPDGSFCVLVGPSGCGKSTLLRMVAGLETISGGTVRIGERVVNQIEPSERDIAMVFQNYALYPHMSVYDNMAYGLRNRRHAEGRDRQARARGGADPRHRALPRAASRAQLSGGQRQRVAMGRAIVRKPQVFLFDEPLSNLDAKLRVQMRVEIKRLQRALGVTSIYVTHDQVEAMTLSDKLVVMNGGQIEQVGTPGRRLPPPADPLRRDLHRLAADEHPARQSRRAEPRRSRRPDARPCRTCAKALPPARRSRSACGRRMSALDRAGAATIEMDVDFVEELGATQLFHGKLAGADFVVQAQTGADPRRRPHAIAFPSIREACISSIRRRRSGSGWEAETPVRQEFRCPPRPTPASWPGSARGRA